MSVSSEVSEEVVKMYLEGTEVVLKIAGAGAKNIAVMLYALMKDNKRMKGRTRLNSLIKRGRNVKIYTLKGKDLKVFSKEAKRYGVLYSVLTPTTFTNKEEFNNREIDILVSEEDAPRIERIAIKCNFVDVDRPEIERTLVKELEEREKSKSEEEKKNDLIDDILSPVEPQKEEIIAFPSEENTEEKNQLEISSNIEKDKKMKSEPKSIGDKKSVRAELNEIKEEIKQKEQEMQKQRQYKSKNTKKHTKDGKYKGKRYKEKNSKGKRYKER